MNLHKRAAAKLERRWTRWSWNIGKSAQKRFERGDAIVKGRDL